MVSDVSDVTAVSNVTAVSDVTAVSGVGLAEGKGQFDGSLKLELSCRGGFKIYHGVSLAIPLDSPFPCLQLFLHHIMPQLQSE